MWAERIASIDVLATARRLSGQPGFVWLDSRRTDAQDGQFSFLSAWPDAKISVSFGSSDPFADLSELGGPDDSVNLVGPKPNEVPRWIGYITYDAFWTAPGRSEPRLTRQAEPVVFFQKFPALIAIDHRLDQHWIVGDDEKACRAFMQRLERHTGGAPDDAQVGQARVDDAELHRQAIQGALRYIALGDVYEVNLARRWSAPYEGNAFELWEAMRDSSHVPLGAFIDGGDHAVLACTMERFLRWNAETRALVTRPIKGTIPRDLDDARAQSRLRADPKERAEHTMIVDLMRNDLGRVAETGSVRVDAPLSVEPFTGLYHLVSTVSCVTRPDATLKSIVEATFPPGSVTGAPKLRALEIIESLESYPRGAYCGAVGFVDRDGGLSLAVSIRTANVRAGEVQYFAGGGIVEASDPGREVDETNLKARVFLDAVARLREGR